MAGRDVGVPVCAAGEFAVPKLGLGTWGNTGEGCAESVRTALELGYRHLDTAQVYDNEAAVGRGLRTASVDRESVVVTTKIWRENLEYDDVIVSVRESRERLGLDRIDLLLIHWPHPRRSLEETLAAMTALREQGVVTHLGVANFTLEQFQTARSIADPPLVTNQVLYHALHDQADLQRYCAAEDVILTAYSPLARGALVGDDSLAAIGSRYDKTAAQVALRWLVQQEGVVAIPKATSRAHLEANLEIFDFALTESEMAQIRRRSPGPIRWIRNKLPALIRRSPVP